MKKWGFIYTLGDEDAQSRIDRTGSSGRELICMGVASIHDAPTAARELLAEGVQLIELCGAFGGAGLASVVSAVEGRVPVGAVFYGGDAGKGLHELFG